MNYTEWLLKVSVLVNRTPETIEIEAGDAPREAWLDGKCTPEMYAKEFLHEDALYRAENNLPPL